MAFDELKKTGNDILNEGRRVGRQVTSDIEFEDDDEPDDLDELVEDAFRGRRKSLF